MGLVPTTHVSTPLDAFITSPEQTFEILPELVNCNKKIVYLITPTYHRLTQKVNLVQMAQALMLDGGIYWIMIEDTPNPPDLGLRTFLYETGLPFAHLTVPTEPLKEGHRGVLQRNAGIDIVHEIGIPGLVYFADDDNVYDHRLFDQLRKIKGIGLGASGFSGGSNFETCVLDETTHKITRFVTNFTGREPVPRKFHVDMGSFTISTLLLFSKPDWRISVESKHGAMESEMVGSFIDSPEKAEAIGKCTELYFWHMPKYSVHVLEKFSKPALKEPAPQNYGMLASEFALPNLGNLS